MSERNILVRFFSAIWSGANGLRKLLHLLLLLFIFMLFIGVMSDEAPPLMPDRAALVIKPVGALVEQLDGNPYDRALAELTDQTQPQTLVQDVVDVLEGAKDDDRIAAVHLELSSLSSAGLDKLRRVADALIAFKESGKKVIASADFYSQYGYYLAAHADEIYLNPNGMIFINGYGSYRTYYKDIIDTLLIDWNLFRAGSHKTAYETYERMDMSPEDREDRQRLLDGLWDAYQESVVAARGLPEDAISEYAENLVAQAESAGGDPAVAARDRGLVDELLGRAELREVMIGHVGADSDDESTYSGVSMRGYLSQLRLRGSKVDSENVAVIIARGSILNGDQPPGTIGGDSTAALLKRALEDESVKAVVLRVDSGGGSAFASDVIADEVVALKEAGKPVVASMSSVAASGGYWISMYADQIFASPTTITGSIGVLGMFPTFQRSLAAIGITTDGVGTTPWSGQLRPDREMSDESRQLFEMFIGDTYNDFINGVAEGRELDVEYVDEIAGGQVWSGEEAFENGLVDVLGDLDEAIVAAAGLAGLEEGDYGQKLIERQMSPTEQLILDLLTMVKTMGVDPVAFVGEPQAIEVFADRLQEMLAAVTRFNDPKGIYSTCFCELP